MVSYIKSALSHLEYLELEYQKVKDQIQLLEETGTSTISVLRELYFKKGKLFSDIELAKRIPHYSE